MSIENLENNKNAPAVSDMKHARDYSVGSVVRAVSGRGAGNLYIVVGMDGDKYAWLCDGKYRRIKNPKRKNIKHVEMERPADGEMTSMIEDRIDVLDSEIRKFIKRVRDGGASD